jgi:hypothetical protein
MNPLVNNNEITIGSSEVFKTINGVDPEILMKKCSGYNMNTCNYFTKWGIRFEPISKEVYELYTGNKVITCKMKSHKHYKWLKAIPDGIVNKTVNENGVKMVEQRLIEFKNPVTRNIHKGTPDKYHSQMQIAMETFNVDTCDYFDCKFIEYTNKKEYERDINKDTTIEFNKIKTSEELQQQFNKSMEVIGISEVNIENQKVKVYWKLKDFILQKVDRNKKWFKNHINNIVDSRNKMIYAKRVGLTNYKKYYNERDQDENKWKSISDTFNFMLKDPLIDWLNLYGRKQGFKKDNEYPNYDETMDFSVFVTAKSKEFKENVREYLINTGEYDIVDITESIKDEQGNIDHSKINYTTQMYDTFTEMLKGRDIIINPTLIDFDSKYYCNPSSIIKKSVLEKMINTSETMRKTRSKKPEETKNDYYVPLFFKFQTIKLCSDSVHLLNTGTIPTTKCKIALCCKVLGQLQQYQCDKGYILGRKYDYTEKGTTYYSNNCFDKIGTIDLSGKDSDYKEHLTNSIKWLIEVRKNGKDWNMHDTKNNNLPSHINLYPNMKNDYNSNWGNAKGIISNDIKEITALWYSSIKNRNIAFSNGIYSLADPKCNTEMLGMSKRKNAHIIDKIIDINYKNLDNQLIYTSGSINNNIDNWQKKSKLELFIDFEDINSINDNFNTFPEAAKLYGNLTFMVGIGHINKKGEWIYKCFLAKRDTKNEEKRIMTKFIYYMIKLCNEYETNDPKLFHYSGPESKKLNYYINKVIDIHRDDDTEIDDDNYNKHNIRNITFNWCDLHKIILAEPFVIRGAHNFTLKAVSKALYDNNHIKTLWNNVSSCTNGISAMTVAFNCYNGNKDVSQNVKMNEVIKYNECDVKVLYEILEYFRTQLSHSKTPKTSKTLNKGKKRKRSIEIIDIETDNHNDNHNDTEHIELRRSKRIKK